MEKSTIKDRIKNAIAEEYKKYTSEPDQTDVYVEEDRAEIRFNSEIPYLHDNFWKMLADVEPKLDEILNPAGYDFARSEVLYDFIIWHYKKKY